MKNSFFLLIASLFIFNSCTKDLDDLLEGVESTGLTEAEIVEGLKTALATGTDSSSTKLSLTDGYFKDEAIKILLPNEVETRINTFKAASVTKDIPVIGEFQLTGEDIYNGLTIKDPIFGTTLWETEGIKGSEDDLILGLNRAAEFAANSSAPIFKEAITGMTIDDGLTILNGEDSAATVFLRNQTYTALFNTYNPIVDSALATVKVGDKSVVKLYEDYVSSYNNVVNQTFFSFGSVGSLLNVKAIQMTNVSEYGTSKALDGLFLKVSEEEQKIRKDPFAYVSDIIQKVFGSLLE